MPSQLASYNEHAGLQPHGCTPWHHLPRGSEYNLGYKHPAPTSFVHSRHGRAQVRAPEIIPQLAGEPSWEGRNSPRLTRSSPWVSRKSQLPLHSNIPMCGSMSSKEPPTSSQTDAMMTHANSLRPQQDTQHATPMVVYFPQQQHQAHLYLVLIFSRYTRYDTKRYDTIRYDTMRYEYDTLLSAPSNAGRLCRLVASASCRKAGLLCESGLDLGRS